MEIHEEYLGKLKNESYLTEVLLEASRIDGETIPPLVAAFDRFKIFPRVNTALIYGEHLPAKIVLNILKEQYNHNMDTALISYLNFNDAEINYSYMSNYTCLINDVALVKLSCGCLLKNLECDQKVEFDVTDKHSVFCGLKVYFKPGSEAFVDELLKKLTAVRMKPIKETCLQMICKNQCGFYLNSIQIKKPRISDLALHYGDDFIKTHNKILEALKEEFSQGIVLLHGLPGSGKTHYIRYLIQEITNKQLIYVPPDMANSITSPDFLPFMLQNQDSILIIEDAENILKDRADQASTTQSVANLLNMSDGLLGDSLHQPIIATFNCELKAIDPALLRKGRLITNHEFGKLDIKRSQKLSDSLGFKTKIEEAMTLSDIYGQEKEDK